MKYTAEDVKDLLSSNFLYIEFGKITEDAAAYLINAAVEREREELLDLREFRDKAFRAHPNIDMDIERLAP